MTTTIALGDVLVASGLAVAAALTILAGDRLGYQRWLEEPDETRRARWERAHAAGDRIPHLKELVLPALIGLAGGTAAALLVWEDQGALAGIGALIGGGVLLWHAAQICAIRVAFRRDAALQKRHADRGVDCAP